LSARGRWARPHWRSFVSGFAQSLRFEDPRVEAQFEARWLLEGLRGIVVIDECVVPELFKVLVCSWIAMRRQPSSCCWAASPALLRQSSESLAGRVEVLEIGGFTLDEIGTKAERTLWSRGGFPRSYLAASEAESRRWRESFIRLFLERDLPQLGIAAAAAVMRRFWTMLAHYHGQVWNAAEPARSLGVNESTVRRYLDWLTQTFMVRQLLPWHENLGKRQVKAPKIYFRDTGLLHELLGVPDADGLLTHPKSGASWEGFALEQMLRIAAPDEAYFWATHAGAELDLLMLKDGRRVGVEFKRMDAPRLVPSMRTAMKDLRLEILYVVYPGPRRYSLAERIEAVPLSALVAQ
jgi:predicted AAA+ superfamily ATPase